MTPRRAFLRQAATLAAAAYARPLLAAAPAPPKIGLQLYSLRDYIGQDVPGVLAKVAQAGYQEVETYGYDPKNGFWGLQPAAFKAALAAQGLSTSSGHYGLDALLRDNSQSELEACIAAANACGQRYLVVPSMPAQVRATVAGCKAVAARLNQAGKRCRAAGLRLGYHNHDFEFKPLGGTSLYEILLRETDPQLLALEMDIYWVVRAGHDPAQLMRQHPGRFPLWHVKDMDKAHPELNTEIGTGSVDFRALAALARTAGLQQLYVEQENFSMDAYQSIGQSAAYLKNTVLPALGKS